jgi:DNA invertase Pin-like site-specific DNA recombinase
MRTASSWSAAPAKGLRNVREIVSYIRVSTEGQHKSGLGEDAQRRALAEFAPQHDLRYAASYSDAASGPGFWSEAQRV